MLAEFAADGEPATLGSERAIFFDREWALTILERALGRVRQEYARTRRDSEFIVLKNFLPGAAPPPSYAAAAGQIGLSIPAFKSELHRLRRHFRLLLREEVAQTVSAPHEIDAEMTHLQQMLLDKGSEFGARPET